MKWGILATGTIAKKFADIIEISKDKRDIWNDISHEGDHLWKALSLKN